MVTWRQACLQVTTEERRGEESGRRVGGEWEEMAVVNSGQQLTKVDLQDEIVVAVRVRADRYGTNSQTHSQTDRYCYRYSVRGQ